MATGVLIADHDPTRRELLNSILTRQGFAVTAFEEGESARTGLNPHLVHLVVCAEDLPGLNGGALCESVKAARDSIKVIILEAPHVGGADPLDSGCDAVLSHPFQVADLTELVNEWQLRPSGQATLPSLFKPKSIPRPKAPAALKPMTMAMPVTVGEQESVSLGLPAMPIPIPLPNLGEASMAMNLDDLVEKPRSVAMPKIPLDDLVERPKSADLPEITLDEVIEKPQSAPMAEIQLDDLVEKPKSADLPEIELDEVVTNDVAAKPRSADLPEIELDEVVTNDAVDKPKSADLPEIQLDDVVEKPKSADLPEIQLDDVIDKPISAPLQEIALDDLVEEPATASPPPIELDDMLEVPAAPGLRGQLAEVGLAKLLAELFVRTFTGVLHLQRGGIGRKIHIRAGMPLHVERADQLSENLGRILMQHGRITEAQHLEAQALVQEQDLRQGEALLAIGALSETDLLDALETQTEAMLVNTFAWQDGEYVVEAMDALPDRRPVTEVHPLRAIWRGVMAHYDGDALRDHFLHDAARYIVPTQIFNAHVSSYATYLRAYDFEPVLDGRTTVAAAFEHFADKTSRGARALYILVVTEMVLLRDAPGGGVTLPGSKSRAVPAEVSGIRDLTELLARTYLTVEGANYFDALRLGHDATSEQVDAAFSEQWRLLKLGALPDGLSETALKHANELAALLQGARVTLRDPAARAGYLQNLSAAAAAPPAVSDGLAAASESRHQEAMSLLAAGKPAEARALLETALQESPGEPLFRIALAQAIVMQQEGGLEAATRRAIACLEQALQLDPANDHASLELARLLIASGDKPAARGHVARVVQRSPEHGEAQKMLAKLST